MTEDLKILNFISHVRNSHPTMVKIYTEGSCLNFHMMLRSIWPQATPWTNIDHVITQINGKFYDITGIVRNTQGYEVMGKRYSKKRESKAYSQQMYNK